jgi:glycosyltransferase involved in cell wall biosynthesis
MTGGKPLMVDVDDWELGFLGDSLYWEFRLNKGAWLLDPLSPLYTRLLDRMIRRADAITVTTSYLQRLYDGEWIPHTRDETEFLPPSKPHSGFERSPRLSVLFLGTVRPHKGLEVLLDAWKLLDPSDAVLRIVGTPTDSRHLQKLKDQAKSVRLEGPVPFRSVPSILSSADLAIISTSVSDIPWWLSDGSGLVVPPGDSRALAEAMERVLGDADLRQRLGKAARKRFLRFATSSAVRPRLSRLVVDVIEGRPRPAPGNFMHDHSA